MSYQTPILSELIRVAKALKQNYKGTNPKRLAFIEFIELLSLRISNSHQSVKDRINTLMGGFIFLMSDIKLNEYKGKSAKKSKILFWSRGSDLYTAIKNGLNITKNNKLNHNEKLFYLNEFYKFVEKSFPEENVIKLNLSLLNLKITPNWNAKKDLIKHINQVLNEVFKLNKESLQCLVDSVPLLKPLLKNLQQLENEYVKDKQIVKNENRRATLNCITFIIQSYENMNPNAISWHACVGAAIVALMQIYSEYNFFSPYGSKLYRECLHALNKENLNNIDIDDKITCMRALSAHITMVMSNAPYYQSILNHMGKKLQITNGQTNLDNEVKKLDMQIKSFQNDSEKFINQLTEEKIKPGYGKKVLTHGLASFVKYAIGPVVLTISKNLIINTISMGSIFTGGGVALFGVGGALLSSGIAPLVKKGLLETASAGLCVWLLDKIGGTIASSTLSIVSYPFQASPKGFEAMRQKLKPEDDLAFVNLVNTLLELDQVTSQEKIHIRKVLGIEKDAKLLPLDHKVKTSEEMEKENNILLNGYHTSKPASHLKMIDNYL